jgi:uncharacterized LabA/DUF88 family protein
VTGTLPAKNNASLNAIVYADYGNIFELLKAYGKEPVELNFFAVIEERLKQFGLNLIDFIFYGDFEKNPKLAGEQSFLRGMGYQIRHTSANGINSGELEITVEALTHLYENPNLEVFVIISGERDIIPLLKSITHKNKFSYLISIQSGPGAGAILPASQYADFHESLEEIFHLTPATTLEDPLEALIAIDADTVSLLSIRRAMEVSRYFYKSHILKRASLLGKPVNLRGYLEVVARIANRHPDEIMNDFRLAHCLRYVTIYPDPERGLCLGEGEKMGEFA